MLSLLMFCSLCSKSEICLRGKARKIKCLLAPGRLRPRFSGMINPLLDDAKGRQLDENKGSIWHPFKGTLALLLCLGAVGIAFFFWKYDDVFPAAAVDLKLSKNEVAASARRVCETLGYSTKGCIESTTFQERSEVATFLEHEYSMKEANALMHSEICTFFWYTRFCRPKEVEEFQVWLGTDGHLAGLNHDIEKERALPSVSQRDAMQIALKFVKEMAGTELCQNQKEATTIQLIDGIKLIRNGSIKQLKRTDHYFTWEDQRRAYKGGHLRYSVAIAGNQIVNYDCELHVPEQFERRFADMRSYNELLKQIAQVLFAVVAAGMVFSFFWAVSTKKIRWRLVLIATVISFFVEILDYWNNWPSVLQGYSTNESFQGYLGSQLVSSALKAVMAALAAAVLVGGIETVYRKNFPQKIAGEHYLNLKCLSNRALLETIIAGICVFGIHLFYVAFYYLVGQKIGMWSPLEVRDVTTISSISPAFSSFAVGVNASVSEELLYRVLCFVLAQRIFKNFWIANLVQAVGWAFMHSDYPQEPAYARGVELTIVGLFYGWMLRRFGVLTGIISHFVYDAFLGITPLLLSQSTFLAATGLLACCPPFLALGLGLLRRSVSSGDEIKDEVLWNENLPEPSAPPQEQEPEERHLDYKPFSAKLKFAIVLISTLSILLSVFVHPRKIGSWAKMTVDRTHCEEIARKFLQERGVKEGDWHLSSELHVNINEEEIQYGFEKEGFKKVRDIMRASRIPMLWKVRFFKPHQRREYDVYVSSEGRPCALQVTEEEEAPGKQLSEADARKITEDFLKKYRPEFLPLEFESAVEQKHDARTDYTVTYVAPSFKMGDARLNIAVDTVGDLVSFPHVSWDIPDAWKFERSKQTVKDHVCIAACQILFVILGILALYWAYGVSKSISIRWRPALIAGAVFGLISIANQANQFVYNLSGYDTDVPLLSYLAELGVRAITSAIFYGAMVTLLFAIGHAAFRILFPGISLQSLWHSTIYPPPDRRAEARALWIDAAFAAYGLFAVSSAIGVLSALLSGQYSPEVQLQSFQAIVANTEFSSPALDKVMGAFSYGFILLCLAPVGAGLYLKYLRSFGRYFIAMFCILLIVESTTKYWQDYLVEVGVGSCGILIFYLWAKYLARNNPLSYFLVGVFTTLFAAIYYIFKFSRDVYSTDLYIMAAIALLPVLIPFLFNSGNTKSKSEDPAAS